MDRGTRVFCFIGCLALCACDAREPKNPPATVPAPRVEPVTAPEAPVEPPKPAAAAPLPPAPNPPGEAAYAHVGAARQATDAILAGDLTAAAPHLEWLAHHEYPQRLPAPYRPHAAPVQLAARILVRASSPSEAMRALPSLSAACGSCHQAIAKHDFEPRESPRAHGDAALALLQGLSGRTADLFTTAAGLTPTVQGSADSGTLEALRKAATRAETATTWIERKQATDELFGLCGACHQEVR